MTLMLSFSCFLLFDSGRSDSTCMLILIANTSNHSLQRKFPISFPFFVKISSFIYDDCHAFINVYISYK